LIKSRVALRGGRVAPAQINAPIPKQRISYLLYPYTRISEELYAAVAAFAAIARKVLKTRLSKIPNRPLCQATGRDLPTESATVGRL
jgi:hypothetical protein